MKSPSQFPRASPLYISCAEQLDDFLSTPHIIAALSKSVGVAAAMHPQTAKAGNAAALVTSERRDSADMAIPFLVCECTGPGGMPLSVFVVGISRVMAPPNRCCDQVAGGALAGSRPRRLLDSGSIRKAIMLQGNFRRYPIRYPAPV